MLNVLETQGRSFALGDAVSDLISGKLDVVWVRKFSDMKTCEKISENFRSRGLAFPRKDNVPGVMVGESHYFKTPGDYYLVITHIFPPPADNPPVSGHNGSQDERDQGRQR